MDRDHKPRNEQKHIFSILKQTKGSFRPLRKRQTNKLSGPNSEPTPLQTILTSSNKVEMLFSNGENETKGLLEKLTDELRLDGKSVEQLKPIDPNGEHFIREITYPKPDQFYHNSDNRLYQAEKEKLAKNKAVVCIDNAQKLSDRGIIKLIDQNRQQQNKLLFINHLNAKAENSVLTRCAAQGLLPVVNQPGAARQHLIDNNARHLKQIIQRGIPGKFASAIRSKNKPQIKGA